MFFVFRENKKGQITLFVIIALALLISFVLFLIIIQQDYNSSIIKQELVQEKQFESIVQAVDSYYADCISLTNPENMDLPPLFTLHPNPSLASEYAFEMGSSFRQCIAGIKSFETLGVDISYSPLKYEYAKTNPFIVNFNMPITISRGDLSAHLDEKNIITGIDLDEINILLSEIIRRVNLNPEAVPLLFDFKNKYKIVEVNPQIRYLESPDNWRKAYIVYYQIKGPGIKDVLSIPVVHKIKGVDVYG